MITQIFYYSVSVCLHVHFVFSGLYFIHLFIHIAYIFLYISVRYEKHHNLNTKWKNPTMTQFKVFKNEM
jgi:hypothetical protein